MPLGTLLPVQCWPTKLRMKASSVWREWLVVQFISTTTVSLLSSTHILRLLGLARQRSNSKRRFVW